jgi:methyltransferase (TIGR00027 family)
VDPLARTALLVAAARAEETRRDDRLFEDPFAEALAGPEGFAVLEEIAAFGGRIAPVMELRTRWFDERLAAATGEGGVRQVVVLAAGVDARAWRVAWPQGARLFELERAPLLAHKAEKLAGVAPRCDRRAVAVDLADDWPAALAAAGHDARAPTAWLIEGLLVYLDEPAARALFARVDVASSAGSVALWDVPGRSLLDSPWMVAQLAEMEKMGCPWRFATDDPEGLMAAIGWRAEAIEPAVFGTRFGRWPFPVAPRHVQNVPRSYFVEATK